MPVAVPVEILPEVTAANCKFCNAVRDPIDLQL